MTFASIARGSRAAAAASSFGHAHARSFGLIAVPRRPPIRSPLLSLPARHSSFHTSIVRRDAATEAAATATATAATPAETVASSISSATSNPGLYETVVHWFDPLVPYVHALPDYLHLSGPHAYAISIAVATILIRTTLTLPVHMLQRERTRRYVEEVKPEFDRLRGADGLPKSMIGMARRAGKSHEQYRKMLEVELRKRYRALVKEHRCHPLVNIAMPLAVTLPILLVASFSIRAGSFQPSPFWDETMPWWSAPREAVESFKASAQLLVERGLDPAALKHLSEPMGPSLGQNDSTFYGPLALLALNWTNIELTQYIRRENLSLNISETDKAIAQQQRDASGGQVDQEQLVAAATTIRQRIVSLLMGAWTIVLIPVSANVPGALLIYWTSSAAFTLAQNLFFSLFDRRKKRLAKQREEQGDVRTAERQPGVKRKMVVSSGTGAGRPSPPPARRHA